MSKTWPRRGIIKFAGTLMDGARDGAYGLLDRLAELDGRAREAAIALLDEQGDKDTPAREAAPLAPAQPEDLARVWAELAALNKKIDGPATTHPQAAGPTDGQPAAPRG
ncbi:hypothetical protein [Streptomyces sp. 058-1L]|uniref:hypothetical protein n=1 Tax=Streptomyces sp. 058-1L TaxID=2789266 RepID=UPI00397F7EFA